MLLLLNTQQNNDAARPYDARGGRTALPRRRRRCGQRAGAPLLRLPAQEARGRGAGLTHHTEHCTKIACDHNRLCDLRGCGAGQGRLAEQAAAIGGGGRHLEAWAFKFIFI